jgi:diaminopimelate decarboxylase
VTIAARIIERNFSASRDELMIGGVSVSVVAAEFGTPLYVYAGDIIDTAWRRLRAALPQSVAIHYSVKANPNPALIRRFLARGAGVEIASAGELHLALLAGATPERVLFAGPGKSDADLELAIKHQIGEIHIESITELDRIAALGRQLGVRVRVGLRVNPAAEAQGGAMRMGGASTAFGVDEETLDDALAKILAEPAVELRGLHLFSGTQILDHGTLLRQYRKALDLAIRLGGVIGQPLATLDLGGGLGIPYFAADQPLDVDGVGQGLAGLIAEYGARTLLPQRFVVEPGRYLVGEAGVYVTRVVDVKVSRGKRFVVLDGGMNHHLAASGNLGQVIKRNFPVVIANRLREPAGAPADIVGPLCTPLDVLARDIELPEARIGDLVVVLQSGAYARAASPLGFLSHPTPAEVLIEDRRPRLIRRAGRQDDVTADLLDG